MTRLALFPRLFAGVAVLCAPGLRAADPVFPAHPDGTDSPLHFPCGKTLVVPIPCDDADGDALTYTVTSSNPRVFTRIKTGNPQLKLHVHSDDDGNGTPIDGDMEFQIYRNFAPETASFIAGYAQSGFYENLLFHRIVPDFVIQGGDPAGTGNGFTLDDPTTPLNESVNLNLNYSLPNEFRTELIFSGRGQLAMANGGYSEQFNANGNIRYKTVTVNPTNGTQFFITQAELRDFGPSLVNLDYKHTIFGQLVRGFDLLARLNSVSTHTIPISASQTADNVPVTNVTMTAVNAVPSKTDAVLLLSASATGTSTVTVTAQDPAGHTATRTLDVTVDVDTINDPPFLDPIDPIVVPVGGKPNFRVRSYDLESDAISTRFPVSDVFSGGQVIYAGLSSENLVAVARPTAGQWDVGIGVAGLNDPAARLAPDSVSRYQMLEIGVGDRAIAATPQFIEATAAAGTGLVRVATFRHGGPSVNGNDFIALVNWGDGSLRATSVAVAADPDADPSDPPPPAPTVQILRSPENPSLFEVRASHTYARPGVYPLEVLIDGPTGSTDTAKGQAVVSPAGATLRALGADLDFSGSPLFAGRPLATFSDSTPGAKLVNFTATVDWGDGLRAPGVIRQTGAGRFAVFGTHRYQDPTRYSVMVYVHRAAPDAEVVAWSSINLAGFIGPAQLPPFAKASITAYWLDQPTKFYRAGGTDILGTFFIVNGGRKPTNKWKIRMWLSKDATFDPSGPNVDTVLQLGPLNKLVSAVALNSLDPGAGGSFPFNNAGGGTDFTIRLPARETAAGKYLIAQLDYTDPITDKMSVPKTVVVGPFNGILLSSPFFVSSSTLTVQEGDSAHQTENFRVKLDTVPTADVTIPLEIVNSSGVVDNTRATLNVDHLTFTPGFATSDQIVVVTAVDDGLKDNPATGTYTIRLKPAQSADPRFQGMDGPDVTLQVQEKAGQQ